MIIAGAMGSQNWAPGRKSTAEVRTRRQGLEKERSLAGAGKKNTAPQFHTWSPTVLLTEALGSLTLVDRTGNSIFYQVGPYPFDQKGRRAKCHRAGVQLTPKRKDSGGGGWPREMGGGERALGGGGRDIYTRKGMGECM